MALDFPEIQKCCDRMEKTIKKAREIFKKPLTLAEKILISHLADLPVTPPVRGETYVNLTPDRVAMQDATAQMALLQFMQAGKNESSVPATVHCDHLIQAAWGASKDLETALKENDEVYNFLKSVSQKYGIGFWGPGTGIIHQIIFENYAFPGGLMIGTDSHTPNAGGMTMLGIGVGGADAVDVMVGTPWELKWPKIIGIKLTGQLKGFASPKDIILKLLGLLTVKGGTGAIFEYFGSGVSFLSATGRSTITNMGAELGATTSVFPFDNKTYDYLAATNRSDVASLAKEKEAFLTPDNEVLENPEKFYDQVIEIDLSQLEPHLVGPFTPDLDRSITAFKKEALEKEFPLELKAALIGSCTNSSYEDLSKVVEIIKDAESKGLKAKSRLYISPGSEQIKKTIERDGMLEELTKFGAVILSNSCGPCIGQWKREDFTEKKPNSIITSFNRNFKSRNDGNPETLAFISSPELIAAQVVAGRIDFNPEKDFLLNDKKESVRLSVPKGKELPPQGFVDVSHIFSPSKKDVEVVINSNSERLQKLEPFIPWNGKNLENAKVLVKIAGKCTTDHISPAGKWLRFRGHLDRISDNLLMGAQNSYTGKTGQGTNLLTGNKDEPFAQIARSYKNKGIPWIIIGDENYGEGSSREHAAMEPRYLGCQAIICRSFARIAENNLKKQGVLVATFQNPSDYQHIREDDSIDINGITELKPGYTLDMKVVHSDGTQETFLLNHSFSDYQIEWFKAGSSLNYIRKTVNKE